MMTIWVTAHEVASGALSIAESAAARTGWRSALFLARAFLRVGRPVSLRRSGSDMGGRVYVPRRGRAMNDWKRGDRVRPTELARQLCADGGFPEMPGPDAVGLVIGTWETVPSRVQVVWDDGTAAAAWRRGDLELARREAALRRHASRPLPAPEAPMIDELRRLLGEATPGPLRTVRERYDGTLTLYTDRDGRPFGYDEHGQHIATDIDPRYAPLVIAAVNALPALLARLEAAEAVVEAVKERDTYEPRNFPHKWGCMCSGGCAEDARVLNLVPAALAHYDAARKETR